MENLSLPSTLNHLEILPSYCILNLIFFIFLTLDKNLTKQPRLPQNQLCRFHPNMQRRTPISRIHQNSQSIRHHQTNRIPRNLPIRQIIRIKHFQIFRHLIKSCVSSLSRPSLAVALHTKDLAVFAAASRK